MRYTLALLTVLVGCSSSPTNNDGAVAADLSTPGADLAKSGFTLTLKNYLMWCSVSINGGTASISDQTMTFAPNTTVNLTGDKASNTFVWGYWRGTTGDTGAAHDTSMNGTVVMSQDRVVQACCPFATAPNTPCPAP